MTKEKLDKALELDKRIKSLEYDLERLSRFIDKDKIKEVRLTTFSDCTLYWNLNQRELEDIVLYLQWHIGIKLNEAIEEFEEL